MLIVKNEVLQFDISSIKCGMLMYGKHKLWPEGKSGFVTHVDRSKIIVQYHPGISNVTNHFIIPVEEVTDLKWDIRWSNNLESVEVFESEESALNHLADLNLR